MPHLRLIGDIHGAIDNYVKLASESDYSIQVGDLGFDYAGIEKLDPARHRVLGGNHDNYASLDMGQTFHKQTPHFLGDYGTLELPGVPKIFYVRGGRSIDRQTRKEGLDWFPYEELSYGQMLTAMTEYVEAKPDIMITHECPAFLVMEVTKWKVPLRPSNTAQALEAMWQCHKPSVWVFGHFHNDWAFTFGGTYFRCLDIGGVYDWSKPFMEKEAEILGLWKKLGGQ